MSTVQLQNSDHFGPFRLDTVNQCLWRGKQEVALKPKAFAVLRYLVEHPGRLVTKNELLDAVWSDTVVSEGVLKFCVREIRKALGDNPQAPRFIETLHRRGYRFIAKVVSSQHSVGSSSKSEPAQSSHHPAPTLVGRDVELAQLHNWLEKASRGERQIIFVTGEPGIGKTALVGTFLARVTALQPSMHSPTPNTQYPTPFPWIGRGQCIEHYGVGEAYLPVLSALGQLCRAPDGHRLIELLTQQAPTWLVQMPALLSATELEVVQRKVAGVARERMLRELAEAVEALTAERPLVLWLEDLHWSDYSTLDLISYLAQRREQARLLVIGTYRPVEVLAREHPLHAVKQELQLHRYCEELRLGMLSEEQVAEYLAARFPSAVGAHSQWKSQAEAVPLLELARTIHRRTEGNPLIMVSVVEELLTQGRLAETEGQWEVTGTLEEAEIGVPENLQQMIERQFERLGAEEQQVLEVASVAGVEFSVAAVAAGIESTVATVEARCASLAHRGQFLRLSGVSEWPDGTVAARYGFIHALYQEVLYGRVTAGRRVWLHQRIGEREEAAYGARAREISAELAVHFECSRDYRRAIKYLGQAGENASGRSAQREAIDLLSKGLALLKRLPDTPECTRQELTLQIALGPALIATKGFAAPEVEHAYARARELCQRVGETPQLFPVLVGLFRFYLLRAELQTAHELGQQCLSLAQSVQDPALRLEAHMALGPPLLFLGEMASAREHAERGIALYDSQQHRSHAFLYQLDPGVVCLSIAAWSLWVLGYPDQALKRFHEALTLARELSHPFSLAFALLVAAVLRQLRREEHTAKEGGEALMALSREQGFPHWLAWGTIVRGWALAERGQGEEGVAQIRQGLTDYRATGAELFRPHHLTLLAEAYGKVGQTGEGLAALAEALTMIRKTGERWYEAELYRLRGELLLKHSEVRSQNSESNPQHPTPSTHVEAEACFLKAIEIARQQGAKSLELRAVMSLARLWQQQGKRADARSRLAEIYNWFTEGFDTADLKEAHTLLEALA